MPQSRSKYQFWKESSLSQQLAKQKPEYGEYAGADQAISVKIARLNTLAKFGIVDKDQFWFKFTKALLNEQRKALFATSERVNEITKMGLQMPRSEDEFYGDIDDTEEEH